MILVGFTQQTAKEEEDGEIDVVEWGRGGCILGIEGKVMERLGRNKNIVVVGDWGIKEFERMLLMVEKRRQILISDIIFIFYVIVFYSQHLKHIFLCVESSDGVRVVTTSSHTLPFHFVFHIVTM